MAPGGAVVKTDAHESAGQQRNRGQTGKPGTHSRQRRGGLDIGTKVALAVGAALVVLVIIYAASNLASGGRGSSGSQAGAYAYQVGNPGPNQPAPALALASTTGGRFNLASQHGHSVLLYFQEGVGCEPCWSQIKDVVPAWSKFRALGIDKMVVITGDSLDALKQKVADEGISVPVLSDPGLAVSKSYAANRYGMMGASADGHTFIVVGKAGTILWRADYGGSPNYTMYVPVPNLLADIRKGLHGHAT